jgi:hypothetical protein
MIRKHAIAAGIVAALGLAAAVSAQAHPGGMGAGMGPGMQQRMAAMQGGEGHTQRAGKGQHAQRGQGMRGQHGARAGAEGCPMAVTAQTQTEHQH